MRSVFPLALLLSSQALAGGLTLDLTGACPGPLELDVVGATRGASIAVLAGAGAGSTPIAGGPCADVDSTLAGPLRLFGPVRDPDGDGRYLLTPRVPDAACDRSFVVVDLASCEVSNAVHLATPGVAFELSQEIDAGVVTCSSVENTPEYTQCNDLQKDGLYFPNGVSCGPLWSVENSAYSDTRGFCASITGSESFEVYYTCEDTRERATWFDHVWGEVLDNGYTQHVRCYYP
ncbi:MAG: hypothetical protein ACI8PZ_004365 [Myxococcota bacterium]|jgi:hypothetical protein